MRLLPADVILSYRRDHIDGDLIVVWRQGATPPTVSDEVELDGLLYGMVTRLWPETGVLGSVLRFRALAL